MSMPDGILIIDKPSDWTSMDVCAKVRSLLKERRVGHSGTLDPMATGVLPVFVGQATKAVSFADGGDKEYIASFRLGLTTDTQDITGTVLSQAEPHCGEADIRALLPRFTGPQEQIPPMYSAVKVNGKRLYDLARRGQSVERKARPVVIHALTLLDPAENGDLRLRVRCSKGTYVRTLIHDLGQALSCGAVLTALRRTTASGFTLEDAVSLQDVQERGSVLLKSVDSLFSQYPAFTLSAAQEKRCLCGNPLKGITLPAGTYRVYSPDGAFLCLSECRDQILTSIKNFFGASL